MQTTNFPFFAKLLTPASRLFDDFYGATWKNTTLFSGDKLAISQYHTLLLVESAYRADADPAGLFTAYSNENRGQYRRTLKTFAGRLSSGLSIIDALEQTPDVLPASSVVAIRHGQATGTLPQTFHLLATEAIDRSHSANTDANSLRIYWLTVGIAVLFVLIYISQRILPTFEKMMQEYGMTPPFSIPIFESFANGFLLSLPWIVLAIILLSVTGLLASLRAYARRNLLPLVTFTKDLLSTATILRLLSLQVHKPYSLNNSLTILAKYHHRKAVRLKLLLARNECELGMNFWQCLSAAHLITPAESKTLQSEQDPVSQAWILTKLADLRDHRANVISDRFVVFLTPALALLWGAIVLWTALVVFHFLTKMVVSLS